MRNYVRVLKIPEGETKSADGKEIGSDWLLAEFGLTEDPETDYQTYAKFYLTTDGVHASEVGEIELLGCENIGDFIVQQINRKLNGLDLNGTEDPPPKLEVVPDPLPDSQRVLSGFEALPKNDPASMAYVDWQARHDADAGGCVAPVALKGEFAGACGNSDCAWMVGAEFEP